MTGYRGINKLDKRPEAKVIEYQISGPVEKIFKKHGLKDPVSSSYPTKAWLN
jgi:hypothetical protein